MTEMLGRNFLRTWEVMKCRTEMENCYGSVLKAVNSKNGSMQFRPHIEITLVSINRANIYILKAIFTYLVYIIYTSFLQSTGSVFYPFNASSTWCPGSSK